jgi:Domain of unknown function (DUF892)
VHDEKGPILDLVIVAGMQRIEHYEIAAYGTDVALAEALGEKEVADLLSLSQTLEEEKQTDLNEALAGEEEEGGSGSPSISRDSGAAPRRLRSQGPRCLFAGQRRQRCRASSVIS